VSGILSTQRGEIVGKGYITGSSPVGKIKNTHPVELECEVDGVGCGADYW
jgi:hypothetical protein